MKSQKHFKLHTQLKAKTIHPNRYIYKHVGPLQLDKCQLSMGPTLLIVYITRPTIRVHGVRTEKEQLWQGAWKLPKKTSVTSVSI